MINVFRGSNINEIEISPINLNHILISSDNKILIYDWDTKSVITVLNSSTLTNV